MKDAKKISQEKSKQPIPPHAKKVFSGVLFDVYQWEQEIYDGTMRIFEKLKRQDTVVVLPVLEDGRILLIRDEQPGRKEVLTVPGGRMDEGETPEETARRELLEETGYATDELIPWNTDQPYSKIDWTIHYFIARNCRKIAEPDPGAGEKITPAPLSFEELCDLVASGNLQDFQNDIITYKLLLARLHPEKMAELKSLLFGK